MVHRYGACVAGGTALVVALGGCLPDSGKTKASGAGTHGNVPTPSAVQVLGKASERTGKIKSFRANISLTSSASGRALTMTGRVVYRLKPTVAMKLDHTTTTVAGRKTGDLEQILVNDTMYVKTAELASKFGKPWVKISLHRLSATSGLNFDAFANQPQQADPAVNARMLTASTDAHKVGTETVEGVTTTHYQGTYSMKDAIAKFPNEQQRANTLRALEQAGIDKVRFDVWLDGQQLPRKTTTATLPGAKLQTSTTMVYTAFDVPVSITAPPAGQVIDGVKLGTPCAGGNPCGPGVPG